MQRVTAWLQLLRLPNIFTAAADVTMGYVVTQTQLLSSLYFVLLVVASCLLYLSGMVLNDVFDAEVDARERPERPIPSGRIARKSAQIVGWVLLIGGVAVAWLVTYLANDWRPAAIATLLAAVILLYDGALKRSRFAPLLMGECRFLNALLGMSLFYIPWGKAELLIAAGVGIYVMGVTIFARTDARVSARSRLVYGLLVLVGGIALLAAVPWITGNRPFLQISTSGWYVLWFAIALIITRRCFMAVFDPSPRRVQSAVRNCVQSIIVLDAAVATGYASPFWGFAIVILLIPTMLLTLWLNAT